MAHRSMRMLVYIFLVCLHVNCVTYLEIFPAGPPPTDNCGVFFETCKKNINNLQFRKIPHSWLSPCLEVQPRVPGNCHLPASLLLGHSGTRKLLLATCLRIYNKVTKNLIHNSSVCLDALLDQQINKHVFRMFLLFAFCRGEAGQLSLCCMAS